MSHLSVCSSLNVISCSLLSTLLQLFSSEPWKFEKKNSSPEPWKFFFSLLNHGIFNHGSLFFYCFLLKHGWFFFFPFFFMFNHGSFFFSLLTIEVFIFFSSSTMEVFASYLKLAASIAQHFVRRFFISKSCCVRWQQAEKGKEDVEGNPVRWPRKVKEEEERWSQKLSNHIYFL